MTNRGIIMFSIQMNQPIRIGFHFMGAAEEPIAEYLPFRIPSILVKKPKLLS